MPAAQLVLDLAPPRRQLFSNFVADPADPGFRTLADRLEAGQWYFLVGPSGSGKSHLAAAVFNRALADGHQAQYLPLRRLGPLEGVKLLEAVDAPLLVVEDVESLTGHAAGQEALFSLLNRAWARQATVLLTGTGRSRLELPDLRSRLGAAVRLTLRAPDDDQFRRIMEALARELEIDLRPRALEYLLARGPRNLGRQVALLEALHQRSRAEQRPVTVPLVRQELSGSG